MDYKLELGAWNSVFAVPCEIADKHLKLAGAVQLKVILWFLRHAGENCSVESIAESLSLPAADVKDSLTYWKEMGILRIDGQTLAPVQPETEISDGTVYAAEKEPEIIPAAPVKASRAVSRPEKPDIRYLTQRMNDDEGIVYLMQSADEIFGRPTNNNDKATLLMIHETDGLPVEVIIMLLRYAADIGKCNIRYIEKIAINWADNDINTLERAEKRIRELTDGRNAAVRIQKLFGIDNHSPTEKESGYADKWINQFRFSDEMLRKAYEICVDSKSKYIPGYVDSILTRWAKEGITTPGQADQEKNGKKKSSSKKSYNTTFDISEYESTSVIDEED